MKKRNIVLLSIGAITGVIGVKYGNSICKYIKSCALRKPVEDVANEIRKTMCKNVEDIKRNTEEMRNNILENPAVESVLPKYIKINVKSDKMDSVDKDEKIVGTDEKEIAKDVHLSFPKDTDIHTVVETLAKKDAKKVIKK